ncbi:helix-turn-helix domain-containing protein, partial [Rhodanobacter lindaniclasticus]
MASTAFEDSADYVQSLALGLQVLRAFDRELTSASLSEVAEPTDLSRAVVRRIRPTLNHLGHVGGAVLCFLLTYRVLEQRQCYS